MDRDSESTVTSLEENNFCNNLTNDILASGLIKIFNPIIERLDERVSAVTQVQKELKSQLEELTYQLRGIQKAHRTIPIFSEKVKELINIKHKVTVISNILCTSQDRLRYLHKLIEQEEARREALLQSTILS